MNKNKYITAICTLCTLCIVFTLIASASTNIPFMEPTGNVVNKQLIKSQYGSLGELFGIGDRIYKNTYNDGIVEYKLERTSFSFLKPAFITSVPSTLTVPVDGDINVPITITGVSSVMDGQPSHEHVIKVYDTSNNNLITEKIYTVNSGGTVSATLQLGTKSTSGVYYYVIKETVRLKPTSGSVEASGNRAYITVTVGSPSPDQTTPQSTQATPPPTGACADGTSNLACSSQKPLYCYYGSLINKASQCGCPSGQTLSGDVCIGTLTPIATTQPPTQTTPPTSPCLTGYVYNPSTDECVEIQTETPGFDSTLAIIAIVGLVIVVYIVLRGKNK